jgi:hypothetical protein
MAATKNSLETAWDKARGTGSWRRFCFQFALFLLAFLVAFSHRPDTLLNAQFWAEDGTFWYADAYNLGFHSLIMPEAGYLHTVARLVALFALFFPLSVAPLIMNLCALAVQILPVNVFLSSRFSAIPLETRILGSLL